jgi:hypothetical protein
MKKGLLDFKPKRKDAIVRELSDEFLVYDKETNRAHCLNRTATDVWKLCNGEKSVAEIIRTMKQSKSPVDEKVIWMAIRRLEKSGLLLTRNLYAREEILLSRRAVLRKMGVASALALPLVTSILVPTPVDAASCRATGQPCTHNAQCCSDACIVVVKICA